MLATGAFTGGCDLGMGDVSLLRVDDGVQVVSVEASGLRDSNSGHVVSRLLALAREEGGRLVVSLALVEDMTSAGVGGLVKATESIAGDWCSSDCGMTSRMCCGRRGCSRSSTSRRP